MRTRVEPTNTAKCPYLAYMLLLCQKNAYIVLHFCTFPVSSTSLSELFLFKLNLCTDVSIELFISFLADPISKLGKKSKFD